MSEKVNFDKLFNDFPYEQRRIVSALDCRLRIQHLTLEKLRLKKRYNQSLSEINSHIKNCEDGFKQIEEEILKESK